MAGVNPLDAAVREGLFVMLKMEETETEACPKKSNVN